MEGGGGDTVEVGGHSYNWVKVAGTSQAAPSGQYLTFDTSAEHPPADCDQTASAATLQGRAARITVTHTITRPLPRMFDHQLPFWTPAPPGTNGNSEAPALTMSQGYAPSDYEKGRDRLRHITLAWKQARGADKREHPRAIVATAGRTEPGSRGLAEPIRKTLNSISSTKFFPKDQ
ncbi:hypothetical protein S40288_10899 [Stachybotrys chartarum IBT 40288]|nr:hypothetical protein S40288_10899 [Stachybotrys chartarum IBT 40288]